MKLKPPAGLPPRSHPKFKPTKGDIGWLFALLAAYGVMILIIAL